MKNDNINATELGEWDLGYDDLTGNLTAPPPLADLKTAPLDVRVGIANRTDLPPSHQHAVAHDKTAKVRAALAANPTLLSDLQEHFMDHEPRPTVREALARNPTLTPANQMRMATTDPESVRMKLACNPNLTPDVQVILRTHPVYGYWLAGNGIPNADTQRWIATDAGAMVRCRLAVNCNVTLSVLITLLADRNREVRESATANALVPADVQLQIAADCTVEQARQLAHNTALNPDAVPLLLARHADEVMCDRLVRNPNTPDRYRRQAAAQVDHARAQFQAQFNTTDTAADEKDEMDEMDDDTTTSDHPNADPDNPAFAAFLVAPQGPFPQLLFPEDPDDMDGVDPAAALMDALTGTGPETVPPAAAATLIDAVHTTPGAIPPHTTIPTDTFHGAAAVALAYLITQFDNMFPYEMGTDAHGWEDFRFDHNAIAYCPQGTQGLITALHVLPPDLQTALGVRVTPLP